MFNIECSVRTSSVMNVQCAFWREFGNHGRGQVPACTAVLSLMNQWHETCIVQTLRSLREGER